MGGEGADGGDVGVDVGADADGAAWASPPASGRAPASMSFISSSTSRSIIASSESVPPSEVSADFPVSPEPVRSGGESEVCGES